MLEKMICRLAVSPSPGTSILIDIRGGTSTPESVAGLDFFGRAMDRISVMK